MANESKSDKDFALQFWGTKSSYVRGHNTLNVTDPSTGKELFKVRSSRNLLWNPKEWIGRFSYRILPPGSKDEQDSIFTIINKDYFGQRAQGRGEKWRIYRGRKRDGHLAYYCVGSYTFWDDTKCYNSVEEYNTTTPVVKLHKKIGVATVNGGIGFAYGGIANELPDSQYLTMQLEADAALFL